MTYLRKRKLFVQCYVKSFLLKMISLQIIYFQSDSRYTEATLKKVPPPFSWFFIKMKGELHICSSENEREIMNDQDYN